jgi:hypothetical protein
VPREYIGISLQGRPLQGRHSLLISSRVGVLYGGKVGKLGKNKKIKKKNKKKKESCYLHDLSLPFARGSRKGTLCVYDFMPRSRVGCSRAGRPLYMSIYIYVYACHGAAPG